MPSCFIEVFLNVNTVEQKSKNMREVEFLIIELSKYIDFYGIISVCADKNM